MATSRPPKELGSFDLFCFGFTRFIISRPFPVVCFFYFMIGLSHLGSKTRFKVRFYEIDRLPIQCLYRKV